MAKTQANKKKIVKGKTIKVEPETVAEAKILEQEDVYWQLTDDEVLLRSPEGSDIFKTSD